jgi:hypothetical protein
VKKEAGSGFNRASVNRPVESFAAAVERAGVTPALGTGYVVFFVHTTLLGVLDRPRLRGLSATGRRRGALEGDLRLSFPGPSPRFPRPRS